MFYLKDKPNENWAQIDMELTTINYEDGTSTPLTTKELLIEFPVKHKGEVLGDCDDVGLLNWLMSVAVDKDDGWGMHCVNMRLEELSK